MLDLATLNEVRAKLQKQLDRRRKEYLAVSLSHGPFSDKGLLASKLLTRTEQKLDHLRQMEVPLADSRQ